MLPGLCRVSVWVKPGWYFSPWWSLILIVHSCQLSKPTVAHVLFGVGIFRCENAVFSQSGERVSKFLLERVPTAFRPRSDRVRNAFGTRSERERSVRLFMSSTVYVRSFPMIRSNSVTHIRPRSPLIGNRYWYSACPQRKPTQATLFLAVK
jgi:hypothetical protein